MSKNHSEVKSISEAIEHLEKAGNSKTQDFKNMLEEDLHKVKKSLEELTPYLSEVKKNVEEHAKNAKKEVEEKVKENPWLALGIVGLIAFLLGWIFGYKIHRHDD